MNKKLIGLLLVMFLLLCSMVLGAKVTDTTSVVTSGGVNTLEIKYPLLEFHNHVINENITLNFHLFDKVTGIPVNSGVVCSFHLYNHTGGHLVVDNNITLVDHTYDYEVFVDGGNFTDINEYSFLFQCNGTITSYVINGTTNQVPISIKAGGFVSESFLVTNAGTVLDTGQSMLYLGFLLVVIFLLGICLYSAITINGSNTVELGRVTKINNGKHAKTGLYFLAYIWFICLNYLVWFISSNVLWLDGISALFRILFIVSWYAFYPILILMLAKAVLDVANDKTLTDLARRGLRNRGGKR